VSADHPADDHHAKERARDQAMVAHKRNTARFFTENRHIAWVALAATIAWGAYGYARMPKAKDPTIEVRVAVAPLDLMRGVGNLCIGADDPRYDARGMVKLLVAGLRCETMDA